MDVKLVDEAAKLVKQREGILNSIQDKYITAIVNGVISELEREYHIKADLSKMDIFMFVVDLSAYRYSNRDSLEGLPKNLEFRLRHFYLQKANDTETPMYGNSNNQNNKYSGENIDKEKQSQAEIDALIKKIEEECRGECQ